MVHIGETSFARHFIGDARRHVFIEFKGEKYEHKERNAQVSHEKQFAKRKNN